MGKKKPVNATVDELNEVKDELQAAIEQLRAEAATKVQCQGDRAQLETQIASLTEQVKKNVAAAAEATERAEVAAKQHAEFAAGGAFDKAQRQVHELDTARLEAEVGLEKQIHDVDSALRNALIDELTSLCENLDKRFADLSQELTEKIELRASQASEALLAQRKQIDAITDRDRGAAAEDRMRIRSEVEAEFARLRQEVAKEHEQIRSRAKSDRAELDERVDALTSTVYQNHCQATEGISDARRDGGSKLDEFRAATNRRLMLLDSRAAFLSDGVTEVRNAATRRVEWLVERASRTLEPKGGWDQQGRSLSWFSPRFHAAGVRDLQLELRRFAPSATIEGDGAGDCALFLWGHKGMSIACRLYIGNRSSTVEKVYNESAPHGTKRLCSVQDQISAEDDTLRIGVELMEVVSDAEPPTWSAEKVLAAASSEDAEAKDGAGPGPFEGSLVQHRHLNHRVLPLVRKEVERMQARMIKRVEWQLEQAMKLPEYVPNRQYICSPVFSVAGIDGMQLIFYPAGYMGSSPGFCSLFIYCPAGVTLKALLSVGNQKREANYVFPDGGAFGRTNFCRYDGIVDEVEDTLLLVLEVEECSQDITTKVGDAPPIQGEVKLTKTPNQVALQDTKVLPSLWSNKALTEVDKPKDGSGYQGFSTLKARMKSGACRPTPPVVAEVAESPTFAATALRPPTPSSAPARRSLSTPLLAPGGGGQTPTHADTLPALGKPQSIDWGGDTSCSSRTRKPRGSRRPVSLAAPPLLAAAPC